MADAVLPRAGHHRATNRALAGIFGLLIITILAVVPLTITFLQTRESDARLIDMAGRQRMLLERHMKELLLTSQGMQTRHEQTRALLRERLEALIHGGSTVARFDSPQLTVLPAAPTVEIKEKLLLQLRRIFERFYRVRSGRASVTPGTGLGLAICKGIVEAHGGRIIARSTPGEDTTILFRLPLATSMPSREGPAATA